MKMKKERAAPAQTDLCIPCKQQRGRQALTTLYFLVSLPFTHPLIEAPSWAYPIKSSVQRITKSELSAVNSKQLRPQ